MRTFLYLSASTLILSFCGGAPDQEDLFDSLVVAEIRDIEELPCGWPDTDRYLPPGIEMICTGTSYPVSLVVRETFQGDLLPGRKVTLEPAGFMDTYPKNRSLTARVILGGHVPQHCVLCRES